MVNFGNGVFDFTSNVSGTANVVSGESTGAIWQNAPIDELRKQMSLIITQSGVSAPYAMPASYFVFQASGGYFARSMISGYIQFSNSNSVDPVMSGCISAMTSGQTQGNNIGQQNVYWSGGGGIIAVGPGNFQVKSAIILKSNIKIIGGGRYSTQFQWASGVSLNNVNQVMFKSSTWDSLSTAGSGKTNLQLIQADYGVILQGFDIDGNRYTVSGTTSTNPTPGVTSRGHGIAFYGGGLQLIDIGVHHCDGAGVIIQNGSLISAHVFVDSNVSGSYEQAKLNENHITNCVINDNGRHGLVVRAIVNVDRLWTFYNGEPGIDVQGCGFFGGQNSRFRGLWCFFDSVNHGGQTTQTYDPDGFEVRMGTGINYVYDSIVEGPYCQGDSFVIGQSGGPTTSTDFTLAGNAACDVVGLWQDSPRQTACLINRGSNVNRVIANIKGPGNDTFAYFSGANGMSILSNNNTVDIYAYNFNNAACALMVGSSGGLPVNSNNINYKGFTNQVHIYWGAAGNTSNNVIAQVMTTVSGEIAFSGVPAISGNNILLQGIGVSNENIRGYVRSSITLSGISPYTIPHGLYTTPNYVNIQGKSSGAPIVTSSADVSGLTLTAISGTTFSGTSIWYEAVV